MSRSSPYPLMSLIIALPACSLLIDTNPDGVITKSNAGAAGTHQRETGGGGDKAASSDGGGNIATSKGGSTGGSGIQTSGAGGASSTVSGGTTLAKGGTSASTGGFNAGASTPGGAISSGGAVGLGGTASGVGGTAGAMSGSVAAAAAVAIGGSTTTRFGLGRNCNSGSQCSSNYCVDGFCCESECGGPCQACGSDGRCNVVPSTDPLCPSVTCPSNTTCANYAPPATGSCKALGKCNISSDCTLSPAPARTSCATNSLCDGNGNCVASGVKCGASTCDLSYQYCCMLVDGGTYTCQSGGTQCGMGDVGDPNTGVSASCDQDSDCPLGKRCCMATNGNSTSVTCWPADDCPVAFASRYWTYPLCLTPAETNTCPSGTTCTSPMHVSGQYMLPPSWKMCN